MLRYFKIHYVLQNNQVRHSMVSYVGEQHGRREWHLCYRRRRKASSWMLEEGKQNIKELSTLLEETATPVYVDR